MALAATKLSMPSRLLRGLVVAAAAGALIPLGPSYAQTVLLNETFEDTNFGSRGWYDSSGGALSTAENYGGTSSLEYRFAVGATNASGGDIGRHAIADTDSIYIGYYIKHSANWVGSGRAYHPHMFYFLSNLDGAYDGPAYNRLNAYIENVGGVPRFIIQDGRNIDETKIGQNLVGLTENRSVAGCNGDADGHGNGDCYPAGAGHRNGKSWRASQVYFDDNSAGPYYKNRWHHVEAYFKLNSVSAGVGQRDGIIRYWYDGNLIMEHTNLVLRTGAYPSLKFNQAVLIPYIGDGSPVVQTMWIDNLTIATARPSGVLAPIAPTNLRLLR